jgi:oxygen-dependent protoporphyrinogen oxidase
MEREHGSLIRGARALRRSRPSRSGAEPSPFQSLRRGMSSLVDALVERLHGAWLLRGASVTHLEKRENGWRVTSESHEAFDARRVILAVPPRVSAGLIDAVDGRAGALLRSVRHTSAALVYLAWEKREVKHPLDASGFLVPRGESLDINAATFVSSKYEGRAPDDHALIRVFFGGARDPEAVTRTDDDLAASARRDLATVLGISSEPRFVHVARYIDANPQLEIGHAERLEALRGRLLAFGDIQIAGGGYDSVGIPDTIKSGRRAGEWSLAR